MTRRAAFVLALAAALAAPLGGSAGAQGHAAASPAAAGSVHPERLELLAARAAAPIAGRSVSVHCDTWAAWSRRSTSELGFVRTTYDPDTRRFVESANRIDLSPRVCHALRAFALAAEKPTLCHAPGQRPGPCFLGRTIPRDDPSPGVCFRVSGASTCYATAAARSRTYWAAYDSYVQALFTLAHEAVHVRQATLGAPVPPDSLVEAQAECWGMQWLRIVAQRFGDSGADAQTLGSYAWLVLYPSTRRPGNAYARSHPYWSAKCRAGGSLDIRARGSVRSTWPN